MIYRSTSSRLPNASDTVATGVVALWTRNRQRSAPNVLISHRLGLCDCNCFFDGCWYSPTPVRISGRYFQPYFGRIRPLLVVSLVSLVGLPLCVSPFSLGFRPWPPSASAWLSWERSLLAVTRATSIESGTLKRRNKDFSPNSL